MILSWALQNFELALFRHLYSAAIECRATKTNRNFVSRPFRVDSDNIFRRVRVLINKGHDPFDEAMNRQGRAGWNAWHIRLLLLPLIIINVITNNNIIIFCYG